MATDIITPEKLSRYFDTTARALKKVKPAKTGRTSPGTKANDFSDAQKTHGSSGHAQKPHAFPHNKDCNCDYCRGQVVFDMAQRYFSDAKHFRDKGDIVTAFAALNYAHGWLDAGARLGLFDVDHDDTLFTVE